MQHANRLHELRPELASLCTVELYTNFPQLWLHKYYCYKTYSESNSAISTKASLVYVVKSRNI